MNLTNDIIDIILNLVPIKQRVKYIASVDSEQNYSVFYKQKYPYIFAYKYWYNYFKKI